LSQAWTAAEGGVLLRVRLTPKGGRDAVDGLGVDSMGRACLRARVAAPPADGAANAALVKLIAKAMGVPKSTVEIRSGLSARDKLLFVTGEGLEAKLRAAFG
jgi:hypothetical protein